MIVNIFSIFKSNSDLVHNCYILIYYKFQVHNIIYVPFVCVCLTYIFNRYRLFLKTYYYDMRLSPRCAGVRTVRINILLR